MLSDMKFYEAPSSSLWQGRKDSLPEERFFQKVTCCDLRGAHPTQPEEAIVLIGFGSDEGVRRNLGRTGAKEGPDAIRRQLGALASHNNLNLMDVGNIICNENQLEAAQEHFATLIQHFQNQGYKTVALGGGHEIAWGHFMGLAAQYPDIGIINFDAHFDLRPKIESATSGTPFWQIRQYCIENNLDFNYCCLGIQPTANTKSLFDSAHEFKVSYLTADQMHAESIAWQMAFLDDFVLRHEHLYVTICLDVFSESHAPGVSAPQAMGLSPAQVFTLLKYITQTGKVVSLDIAELSPPLDQGQQTARLAANLLAKFLNLIYKGM
ncbi:formimidoylglutamase [Legionella londiniensis]|uniref:Formimidoylglutamase n=1 Tax=Legionella londiniensis TaxID=45068 RepID=A0A0W0VQ10_9GAMM|nr:formimidoylglutamase [Legionella londiniensis]KTD21881.1 formimidoylglutamase [Legionella londiniensis]STX92636.1 formimidoylglutamase [Legionella londiniensis]